MAERPILFSGAMVRAILEGRKTQTRRVLNPQPSPHVQIYRVGPAWDWRDGTRGGSVRIPYAVDDLLWVRETITRSGGLVAYAADGKVSKQIWPWPDSAQDPRPSIHMPREFSRITLRVTDVRVQRVQEISEDDAIAEGVPEVMEGNTGDEIYCPRCDGNGVHGAFGANYGVTEVDCRECEMAVLRYRNLWDSINAKRGHSWDANPWVVAISFETIDNG